MTGKKSIFPYIDNGKPLEVGIIGVGGIGGTVAHDLLYSSPNIILNLKSRNTSLLEIQVRENIVAARPENTPIVYEKAFSRIRLFNTVDGRVTVGDCKKRLLDSEYIIIAARNSTVPFSEFRQRDDEYKVNKDIIKSIAERLEGYKGIVIVVTNPIELTAELIARTSKIPRKRIVAVSYTDTIRFHDVLREEIRKAINYQITESELREAIVIGEHGPTMVPVYSLFRVNKKRFIEYTEINRDTLRNRIKQVLGVDPTRLQTSTSSTRNVRKPALAVVQTLDHLLRQEFLPMSSFDGDCFITLRTKSNQEQKIERDNSLLKHISKNEEKRYLESKEEILRRLRKAELL